MRATTRAVFAVVLLGCSGKVRVSAETRQVSDKLLVTLTVDPPAAGTAHFSGPLAKLGDVAVPSSGKLDVEVALSSLPAGKQSVDVTFAGKGHGFTSFTFEREPAEVRLEFVALPKEGAFSVSCQGELCAPGARLPITADALLSVKLAGCSGCVVEFAGTSVEVKEDDQRATFDLTRAIADGMAGPGYIRIPVKITPPGGEAGEPPELELLGSVPTAIVLGRVSKGPVAFPRDKDVSAPRAAIVVRSDANYGVVARVGDAKRIRDFELVGVAVASEKSLGSCGDVAHMGVSYAVTMYERRSGKVLGKRNFQPANEGCGDNLVSETMVTLPATGDVEGWAEIIPQMTPPDGVSFAYSRAHEGHRIAQEAAPRS